MVIVQKYGGTSVGSFDRIRNVAQRVQALHKEGHQVAVVVSAMSGVTDKLIAMAKEMSSNPPERELDVLVSTGEQQSIALLSMALCELGVPAQSITGRQAGLRTSGTHTRARIDSLNGKETQALLKEGKVLIIAGFQGINNEGEIQTLGRGGSDLSAIAIAASLEADICQILTDVDGVYTADPRVVKNARKLPEISYDELLELASVGTKVMQSRSVEFAKKFGVKFEVRSSLNTNPGTIVTEEHPNMESVVIRGVSIERSQARITISGIPDEPGMSARILEELAEEEINIDMIVSNIASDGCARHSLVGIGMRSHSGVAAQMFKALGEAGINIGMITTSEIKISVTVPEHLIEQAAQAVHDSFKLDKAPA